MLMAPIRALQKMTDLALWSCAQTALGVPVSEDRETPTVLYPHCPLVLLNVLQPRFNEYITKWLQHADCLSRGLNIALPEFASKLRHLELNTQTNTLGRLLPALSTLTNLTRFAQSWVVNPPTCLCQMQESGLSHLSAFENF